MNLRRDLTLQDYERLRHDCNFSDEEKTIFDLIVRDRPRIQIADAMGMSIATVDRRIRNIKAK